MHIRYKTFENLLQNQKVNDFGTLYVFFHLHDNVCFGICGYVDPEGGGGGGGDRGSGPPLKNHKAIGFLSNTGPDPLKNHKATKPAHNVGPSSASQQNAILMLFHWLANIGCI